VRYLILPSDRQPPVPADKVAERGRHVLWETPNPSYVDLVDVLPPISADRTNLGLRLQDWFHSDLPGRGANPGVAFEGEPAPAPTVSADDLPDTPAGTVVSEDVDLRDGAGDRDGDRGSAGHGDAEGVIRPALAGDRGWHLGGAGDDRARASSGGPCRPAGTWSGSSTNRSRGTTSCSRSGC
jgi:hypothetical protein